MGKVVTAALYRLQPGLDTLAAAINAAHLAGERAARRSLEHFHAAGEMLLQAKAVCGHGRWLPWLRANVEFSERRAQRYMELAKYDAASDLAEAWRRIDGHAPLDEVVPHVAQCTGEVEWFTPRNILDAARAVLGAIDLDPASCVQAQKNVRAARYFTMDNDGLSNPWTGRVWLNPPYAPGLVEKFVGKLVKHYQSGDVTAAVVLVNNATETAWFQTLAAAASAICFPKARVKFLSPDGESGAPLQGQALAHLGDDAAGFCETFSRFGFVVTTPRRRVAGGPRS